MSTAKRNGGVFRNWGIYKSFGGNSYQVEGVVYNDEVWSPESRYNVDHIVEGGVQIYTSRIVSLERGSPISTLETLNTIYTLEGEPLFDESNGEIWK